MKHDIVPVFFRINPAPFGGFVIELYDRELKAMGLASHNHQPIVCESRAQAHRAAKLKNLTPFPRTEG